LAEFVLRPTFAVVPKVGLEFDGAVSVKGSAGTGGEYVQAIPVDFGIEGERARSRGSMPRVEQVLRVIESEGRESGTHESGGRRRDRTTVKPFAALDVGEPTQTRTPLHWSILPWQIAPTGHINHGARGYSAAVS
jgi:hypothetical protein